ncbi:MAG: metallophosphoesterase family protein [Anaerolineae bacterium]
MKIGLISDTHLSSGKLPQAIANVFQGVDLILHAGDLVTMDLLRPLEAIAPVTAVQGNMDMSGVRFNLPLKTIVEAEGHQIGLIHGHHIPHPDRVLSPPIDYEAMHNYLLSEFQDQDVDCIVYGHTHQAHMETYQDVLIMNPGSATRGKGGQESVGLLTFSRDQIRGEIIQMS